MKETIKNSLVSVIILSFNRKEDTLKCLYSLYEQEYQNLEIIVLDNGSIDGSAQAIMEHFPDVLLMKMPKNYGDWEGRDIAFCNATGEYILCLDNDAVIEPGAISEMVSRMDREPDLAVVEAKVIDPVAGKGFSIAGAAINIDHYRGNFLGGAALYRSKALKEAEGFPHYLLGGAEAHLTLRFLDMGYKILHLGNVTIFHEMSPKERVPHQRFYLSSKQKLRAYLSHYPGVARPLLDFLWKLVIYTTEGVRRGYALKIPKDISGLIVTGVDAWITGRWRVNKETICLIDFLQANVVTTREEYAAIPKERCSLLNRLKQRIRHKV